MKDEKKPRVIGMDDLPPEIRDQVKEISKATHDRLEAALGDIYRSELKVMVDTVYPLYIEGTPEHEGLDADQKMAIEEYFVQHAGRGLADSMAHITTEVVGPQILAEYLTTEICVECSAQSTCGNYKRLTAVAAGEPFDFESALPEPLRQLLEQAKALGGEVQVVSGSAGDMAGIIESMAKESKKRVEGEDNPLAE